MTQDEMQRKAVEKAKTLQAPIMRDDTAWPKPPYLQIKKCGVLPYRIIEGCFEYYLFKPRGDKPELGDPGFQIPKGTREEMNGEPEPLFVTALREGIEEIGLPLDAIISAGNWGQAAFKSASTGELRTMWLYPLLMRQDVQFDEPDKEHAATVARKWLDIENQTHNTQIRPDHLRVIKEIDTVLRRGEVHD